MVNDKPVPQGDDEGLVDINAILEELSKEEKPRTIMMDFEEIRNRQRDLDLRKRLDRPIVCPFCEQDDFDQIGLKYHLSNHCLTYQNVEVIGL